MIINSPFISGSTTITGNLNVSGSISGTISGSVNNAISASYAVNATSASYAATSSFANDLTVLGTITAQKLNVQQVTSSVVYSSGSNVFGNDISNTQVMTGSVNITGSLIVKGPTTLSDNINSVRINSTTEDSNYIIGSSNTGQSITTGARNIAMGFGSLRDLTSGVENVILGYYAAFNINGSNNIGIGQNALGNIGNGNNNIGIGVATFGNGSAANGSNRIAIGYAAGANSPGAKGIYIGYQAGSSISTGSGNVIIGGNNGSTISGTNNNIILADGEGNIKIQITSGGNVLIATTTDTGLYKLDVNGTGRFSGALTGTSATFSMPSGNGALTIANSSLSGKNWTFLPLTNGAESNLLLFYAGASAGTRLTITNDGNLGLGVTPSAWNTPFKAFQLGTTSALWDVSSVTGLSNNLYNDGSSRYLTSNFATIFEQSSGQFRWLTAPSGTAGNAISFTQAMTLDASGTLLVGDTTNPYSLGRVVFVHNSSRTRSYFQRGVDLIEVVPSDGTTANIISSSYTASGSAYKPLSLSARQNSADLYLSTGGNVGIGTDTDAGYKLDVNGTGRFSGALTAGQSTFTNTSTPVRLNNAGGRYTQLDFLNNGTQKGAIWWDNVSNSLNLYTGVTALNISFTGAAIFSSSVTMTYLTVGSSGGEIGNFNSTNANGGYLTWQTSGTTIADIGTAQQIFGSGGNDTFGINARATRNLVFGSNNTERMRITSGGEVQISNNSSNGVANTNFRVYALSSNSFFRLGNNTNNSLDIQLTRSDSATMFSVEGHSGAGFLNSAAWSYGSDRRIKENINYIAKGLDKVLNLKPAKFDYINGTKNNIGWIAQDIQEVIPEAVTVLSETNDQLTLKSDFIIPYLVKAIQEQQAQINELKALIK
jgi:hypothetical protein